MYKKPNKLINQKRKLLSYLVYSILIYSIDQRARENETKIIISFTKFKSTSVVYRFISFNYYLSKLMGHYKFNINFNL